MSFCATATVAANSAVAAPIEATIIGAHEYDSCSTGAMRVIKNTPAVTMVAAWISAETGVGPSIASGSHRYSGSWALLPHAPTKSSSAMAVAVTGASSPW